ncbi:unnamed protein product [Chrysoparadoxa australica]
MGAGSGALREERDRLRAQLDGSALIIIDSSMRGDKTEEALEPFYRLHGPSFASFRADCECTLQMTQAYDEYLGLMESLMDERCIELGVEPSLIIECAPSDVAHSLSDRFRFVSFADMMRSRWAELYSSNPSDPSNPAAKCTQLNVRCLWDVENLPVPKGLSAFQVVQSIKAFLRELDLEGRHVRTFEITAFFSPHNCSVSKPQLASLDRAGVEMVMAGDKAEAADRKLVKRLNREMDVLEAGGTTFVILSSDNDYADDLKRLRERGYSTVLISSPRTNTAALVAEAKVAYDWNKVLEKCPAEDEPQVVAACKHQSKEARRRPSRKRGHSAAPRDHKLVPRDHGLMEGQTYSGICKMWHKGGWGMVRCTDMVANHGQGQEHRPEQQDLPKKPTVFVHWSALLPKAVEGRGRAKTRYLVKAEAILFEVLLDDDRGPKAVGVRAAKGALACEQACEKE